MELEKPQHSETVRKIFSAAIVLLGEKGYAGATMDEIIAKAGVSKGAVYWHFKSKRELFIDLFEFWMQEFAEGYKPIFESDAPPQDKIHTLIATSGRFLEDSPDDAKVYLEFLNLAIKDYGFVERMLVIFEEYRIKVKKIIEEGIGTGVFRSIDADRTAELMISALDGLLLRASVDPQYQLEKALQFFSTFVFRALGYEGIQVKE